MMDIGDKVVALAAIAFINAMFALVIPWMAMFAAIVSLPLVAAIIFR
ncbi:hypothetical protein [Haloarchaeobius sp. DYHT-AS-18]